MSFYLIKGTFHVKGKKPDGDSVRFKAKNKSNWKKLKGPKVDCNNDHQAQLRMEAIDALETHYQGCYQPWKCATTARSYLLKQLKIDDIVWNDKQTTVESAKDETKGYILSNEIEPYRRPVSFVFIGEPKEKDGSKVHLDRKWLKKSINYKIIKEGLAYPTYYENLYPEIREEFNKISTKARKRKKGIWPLDKTNLGLLINAESITEDNVVLPKLFRRMVSYLKKGDKDKGFLKYLEENKDPVQVLPSKEITYLHKILTVEDNKVKLIPKIEDLIFKEKKPEKKTVKSK